MSKSDHADHKTASTKSGTSHHPQTQMVHAGTQRSGFGEVSEAIFLTQGFVYGSAGEAEARFQSCPDDEYIYARYGNPTVRMFEDRMAALEGAEDGFATASGMAAVTGVLLSLLQAGDHLVAARQLFGSCLYVVEDLLPRYGVETTLVDGTDLEAWKAALRPNTKVSFIESLSNPALEVLDIRAIAALSHEVGAMLVVDNVFSTPVFSRPLELGADVVIYSTTKHVDGQGRCLGGIALGSKDFIRGTLEAQIKHTGAAMSPFTAWVMLKGLETVSLRCEAQARSAQMIAEALEGHPALSRVIYPHLASHPQFDLAKSQLRLGGTMLAFEVAGGKRAAFEMLDALKLILISNNLGDAKSLVTHPATTTHQRLSPELRASLGISDGLVRLSVGLEHADDLIADLTQALTRQ